ncbi:uncharacterized protein LOC129568533 [Sitodiplosis mosellana]|uniref:uncharacterized protein LOC129568533 n=1 Tax=Sitodiplosis mosellana TaxID=263140 RepID=UPI0024445952|nr:uncharacterized protein LOC129568533 [Sitodiplosis mosellana]
MDWFQWWRTVRSIKTCQHNASSHKSCSKFACLSWITEQERRKMGNSPSKSDVEASQPAKRSCNQSCSEITSPKKPKITVDPLHLTDINDDCLEVIFKCLGWADLVNVADSDERFVGVAQSVYSRRYQSKAVSLNLNAIDFKAAHDKKAHADPKIGKEIAEAFFRQFGHLVSSVSFNSMAQYAINIEKSLLKHCADSLTALELLLCRHINFETLNEPLEKVESLAITKSFLGQKLSKLNIWFPNLVSLRLVQVELQQPKALEVNFAQLKQLVIYNEDQTIPQATIGELLRFNPQLKTLILQCKLDVDFLQRIAECTSLVETLELWAPNDRFESFGEQKVSFEGVKKFKLNSWFHWGEFLLGVPFKFSKLDKLSLNGFNEFKGEMLNFIKQNQDVTELSLLPILDDWDDLTFDDLESIVVSLPKLVELEFCGDLFTRKELILLLSKNKDLKKVRLWMPECDFGSPKFCRFRSATEVEWIITTHSVNTKSCGNNKRYGYIKLERQS